MNSASELTRAAVSQRCNFRVGHSAARGSTDISRVARSRPGPTGFGQELPNAVLKPNGEFVDNADNDVFTGRSRHGWRHSLGS